VVFVEHLAGFGYRLADGVRVDPQQLGQHDLGADLAQVDDGDQHTVGGGEQARAARARCPAPLSVALFERKNEPVRSFGIRNSCGVPEPGPRP
jgi:hypothetical protein